MRWARVVLGFGAVSALELFGCFEQSPFPPFPCAIEDAACPTGYVCDRHRMCQFGTKGRCVPATTPCDLVCQNGCGQGQKCTVLDASGTPTCGDSYDVNGSSKEGDACAVDAECDRGLLCAGCPPGVVCENQTSICQRFCRDDSDCTAGTHCTLTIGSALICTLPPRTSGPYCTTGTCGVVCSAQPGEACSVDANCCTGPNAVSGAMCIQFSSGNQCAASCASPSECTGGACCVSLASTNGTLGKVCVLGITCP